jgi:hypothetical protein
MNARLATLLVAAMSCGLATTSVFAQDAMGLGRERVLGVGFCHEQLPGKHIPNTPETGKGYWLSATADFSVSLSRPVLPKAKPPP